MELSEEQKKALEEQKKQCIFCRIINKEMPSKIVYEDDKVIAILDINPASEGHTLVMPKEHYPIMPLIPPEEFTHLSKITYELSKKINKALLKFGTNIFIANGYVAGQQSNHFMLHIIPREEEAELENFNLKSLAEEKQPDLSKLKEFETLMKSNLFQILSKFSKDFPLPSSPQESPTASPPGPIPQPSQLSKEKLSAVFEILKQNPLILELLIKDPEKLGSYLNEFPDIKKVFEGINLKTLSEKLKSSGFVQQKTGIPEQIEQEETQADSDSSSGESPENKPDEQELKKAKELSPGELIEFIESKPKLKDFLLNNTEELKKLIPRNEKLSFFFEGSDVDEISSLIKEYEKKKKTSSSLDSVTKLLSERYNLK